MPEGPETYRSVLWLRDQLKQDDKYPYLVNFIKFGSKFPDVNIESLRDALDKPITNIFSKGKEYYIIIDASQENHEKLISIRAHHGMKGKWQLTHPDRANNVHFRLDLAWDPEQYTNTQVADFYLYYINERFGQFEILLGQEAIQHSLNKTAKDFLGPFLLTEAEWLISLTAHDGKLIRTILMSQSEVCSGIGNYLLAEILYEARLHPSTTLNQLDYETRKRLYQVCLTVIQGHANGSRAKVIYNKKNSPLGNPVVNEKMGGRTMWYCPLEQPIV